MNMSNSLSSVGITDQSVGDGESNEPPDDITNPTELFDFPSELKCPVLLFKPELPGHSHIYCALDNLTQHRVAIKRIKITCQSNNTKILSTIRELRALRGLEHESIVKFLDAKISPKNVYIVQELMDTDLECIIDRRQLGMEHIKLFSFQLLRAVNFIHSAHIIHRDIQTSNVFINVDTLMLKLGDFGSSRVIDNREETRLLSLPEFIRYYHAPEIVLGDREYSFQSDIFSMGVIFYALSHGCIKTAQIYSSDYITYWTEMLSKLPPSGDSDWDDIIRSCLKIDPSDRKPISDLLKSSFYELIYDGNAERISRIQFHIEDEIFDTDDIYNELIHSVKSCRPDDEVSNGLKLNSSIRSFVDVSSTCELSAVSEHEARILQTDYDFGIQIHDCSDKKDRMLYEDHPAELGQSFNPYKWDKKVSKDTDSGYQSGDIKTSDLTQSNSPDMSSDHDECHDTCERDLELFEEANRHHFDRVHVHSVGNHSSLFKHPHKHKHKQSKKLKHMYDGYEGGVKEMP